MRAIPVYAPWRCFSCIGDIQIHIAFTFRVIIYLLTYCVQFILLDQFGLGQHQQYYGGVFRRAGMWRGSWAGSSDTSSGTFSLYSSASDAAAAAAADITLSGSTSAIAAADSDVEDGCFPESYSPLTVSVAIVVPFCSRILILV